MDVHFYRPDYIQLQKQLENGIYPLYQLGDACISSQVVDGPFGTQLKVEEYQETGIPLIRVSDCRTGDINDSDGTVFISTEKHAQLIRSEVLPNDVLITKAGHILGYSAVFPENFERGNITSHLASIRPTEHITSQYLSYYLRSQFGNSQIYRWGHKATRPELNTEEVRQLLIPLPPLDVQKALVADLDKARAERKAKLAAADELLKGMDAVVMHELGLKLPQEAKQSMFAVKLGNMKKRWDVHYQQPHFQTITSVVYTVPNIELGNLVEISHETVDPKTFGTTTFQYIEISGVDLHTGEVTLSEELTSEPPSRARMLVRENDILVSLTRPHRGAITLLDKQFDQCVASTGFAVLRQLKNEKIKREYLLCVLRTRLGLGQLERGSSGGSYPAITEDEMAQILIPTPSIDVQERIITELQNRRERARQLRLEADALWHTAQQRFENALIQQPENSELITQN